MVLLKKAQTEALGLVIIVVILAFALIFALQFIGEDNNKVNERYLKLNADNLRSVILKTNINTCNIKDEILNCNEINQPVCLENCNQLNFIIKNIIESSIKNDYEFFAGDIKLNRGNCLNKNILSSSVQPFPNSNINVSIRLC